MNLSKNSPPRPWVGIRNISDYSPFGVLLKERTVESEFFRRGFNGMEVDNEVKGKGNSYTTDFRQLDVRIGRWLALDPVTHTEVSPYSSFDNNPTLVKDPSGADGFIDKDGNYLGDDGGSTHETKVIGKDEWNKIVGNATDISEKMRVSLNTSSTKLQDYVGGIKISDNTWSKLKSKGGEKLTPFLENNSSSDIFFKPETGSKNSESIEVKSGQDVYSPIDGIAAPHIRKEQVYKVVTGYRASVDNNDISTTSPSIKASLGQAIKGGWKGRSWLNYVSADKITTTTYGYALGFIKVEISKNTLDKVKDDSWVELFDSSGLAGAQWYRKNHTYYKTEYLFK